MWIRKKIEKLGNKDGCFKKGCVLNISMCHIVHIHIKKNPIRFDYRFNSQAPDVIYFPHNKIYALSTL